MVTKNPKISAYVPQIINERFEEFKKERNIASSSQAIAEILAEYFGISLADNSIKCTTGSLFGRLEQLEQSLFELKQYCVDLSNKVDTIQTTGILLQPNLDNKIPISDGELPVSTPEESTNGLLGDSGSEIEDNRLNNGSIPSELKSDLPDLQSYQIETSVTLDHSNTLGSLPSESNIKLNYSLLVERLGGTEAYLKNKKSTSSPEQFTEWTTKRDPDKIGWKSVKEGRNLYFIPASDLSDEQKANLQDWWSKNQTHGS